MWFSLWRAKAYAPFIIPNRTDRQLDAAQRSIHETCRTRSVSLLRPVMEPGEFFMPPPVEVQVGGATVFVTNVEYDERV